MDADTDTDIDVGVDEFTDTPEEKKTCLTCKSLEAPCKGCGSWCAWGRIGKKCFDDRVSVREAISNIKTSLLGGAIECPHWTK